MADPQVVQDLTQQGTGIPIESNDSPQNPNLQTNDILSQIDEEELTSHITDLWRKDIKDRDEYGWMSKRMYDIKAYEMHKKDATYPWKNSSNYPVPITTTLLDVAQANIDGSVWNDPKQTVSVEGLGAEDLRTAPILQQVLNSQIYYEINAKDVWSLTVHRTLKMGNGFIKVIMNADRTVKWISIPAELMFVPMYATGLQKNDTDHVFQLVALSQNDYEQRKVEGIYENIDKLKKGLFIEGSTALRQFTQLYDVIRGTSLDQRMNSDFYYILECYLTYWVKPKNSKEPDDVVKKVPVELVVWYAPNGRVVLKKRINELKVRPYADGYAYESDGRYWKVSLPEKLRHIQEEADYAHKQHIDAADISIMPPAYYRQGSSFNPDERLRTPAAFIPVPEPKDIFVEQRSLNPVFERAVDKYWDDAERLTGLTELFQGRVMEHPETLGQSQIRTNKAENRFDVLFSRFEAMWGKAIYLTYLYDSEFMAPDKVVAVTGYKDFKSVSELFPKDKFPNGMRGSYNFGFGSKSLIKVEREKAQKKEFYTQMMINPLVSSDKGAMWKISKMYAEAEGIDDFERYVTRPPEARVVGVDEAIERVMSGELDIQPDQNIDAADYSFNLEKFIRSDMFKNADKEKQIAFARLLAISQAMQQAQAIAKQKIAQFQNAQAMQSMLLRGGGNGKPNPTAVR